MVKSEKIFSPQNYLACMTGEYPFIPVSKGVLEFLEDALNESFGEGLYWSYPLSEIDHIVAEGLNVVLVDCTDGVYNEETHTVEMIPCYRWFEVPEDFEEDEE